MDIRQRYLHFVDVFLHEDDPLHRAEYAKFRVTWYFTAEIEGNECTMSLSDADGREFEAGPFTRETGKMPALSRIPWVELEAHVDIRLPTQKQMISAWEQRTIGETTVKIPGTYFALRVRDNWRHGAGTWRLDIEFMESYYGEYLDNFNPETDSLKERLKTHDPYKYKEYVWTQSYPGKINQHPTNVVLVTSYRDD